MKYRTHRERVKAATLDCERNGEKLNIFKREARVEFYLIEDLQKSATECATRIEQAMQNGKYRTKAGLTDAMIQKRRYEAFAEALSVIIEIAMNRIWAGDYSGVTRMIPEHELMRAARAAKVSPKLKQIVEKMLNAGKDIMENNEDINIEIDELAEDIGIDMDTRDKMKGLHKDRISEKTIESAISELDKAFDDSRERAVAEKNGNTPNIPPTRLN